MKASISGFNFYPECQDETWRAAEQFDSQHCTSYRYVGGAGDIIAYGAIRYLREGQGRMMKPLDQMAIPSSTAP